MRANIAGILIAIPLPPEAFCAWDKIRAPPAVQPNAKPGNRDHDTKVTTTTPINKDGWGKLSDYASEVGGAEQEECAMFPSLSDRQAEKTAATVGSGARRVPMTTTETGAVTRHESVAWDGDEEHETTADDPARSSSGIAGAHVLEHDKSSEGGVGGGDKDGGVGDDAQTVTGVVATPHRKGSRVPTRQENTEWPNELSGVEYSEPRDLGTHGVDGSGSGASGGKGGEGRVPALRGSIDVSHRHKQRTRMDNNQRVRYDLASTDFYSPSFGRQDSASCISPSRGESTAEASSSRLQKAPTASPQGSFQSRPIQGAGTPSHSESLIRDPSEDDLDALAARRAKAVKQREEAEATAAGEVWWGKLRGDTVTALVRQLARYTYSECTCTDIREWVVMSRTTPSRIQHLLRSTLERLTVCVGFARYESDSPSLFYRMAHATETSRTSSKLVQVLKLDAKPDFIPRTNCALSANYPCPIWPKNAEKMTYSECIIFSLYWHRSLEEKFGRKKGLYSQQITTRQFTVAHPDPSNRDPCILLR